MRTPPWVVGCASIVLTACPIDWTKQAPDAGAAADAAEPRDQDAALLDRQEPDAELPGDDSGDSCSGTSPEMASEVCNGVDDDCDGELDENVLLSFYSDQDNDGAGAGAPVLACDAPEAHVPSVGDCDDARSDVGPQAQELCDGVDNNCDGITDERLLASTPGLGWTQSGASKVGAQAATLERSAGGAWVLYRAWTALVNGSAPASRVGVARLDEAGRVAEQGIEVASLSDTVSFRASSDGRHIAVAQQHSSGALKVFVFDANNFALLGETTVQANGAPNGLPVDRIWPLEISVFQGTDETVRILLVYNSRLWREDDDDPALWIENERPTLRALALNDSNLALLGSPVYSFYVQDREEFAIAALPCRDEWLLVRASPRPVYDGGVTYYQRHAWRINSEGVVAPSPDNELPFADYLAGIGASTADCGSQPEILVAYRSEDENRTRLQRWTIGLDGELLRVGEEGILSDALTALSMVRWGGRWMIAGSRLDLETKAEMYAMGELFFVERVPELAWISLGNERPGDVRLAHQQGVVHAGSAIVATAANSFTSSSNLPGSYAAVSYRLECP